jgi:hypothetical protein
VITLRHAWRPGDDGRVLDAIRRVWRAIGTAIATQTGRVVEVCDPAGFMVDVPEPESCDA